MKTLDTIKASLSSTDSAHVHSKFKDVIVVAFGDRQDDPSVVLWIEGDRVDVVTTSSNTSKQVQSRVDAFRAQFS